MTITTVADLLPCTKSLAGKWSEVVHFNELSQKNFILLHNNVYDFKSVDTCIFTIVKTQGLVGRAMVFIGSRNVAT